MYMGMKEENGGGGVKQARKARERNLLWSWESRRGRVWAREGVVVDMCVFVRAWAGKRDLVGAFWEMG